VLGLLGFGCYQILWTTGLTQISAGDSALLVAASPVVTALLAAAVGMDRLTGPKLAGALIAFAGVAVVIGGSQALSLGSSLVGDALTLGAAVLWAIYTVGASRVVTKIDPLSASTWTVVAGAALLVPLGVAESVNRGNVTVTPEAVVAILYSGALAAGIANVFVLNAVRYVGPTRATAMQFLVPAGAVVLGAIFLAEPIGAPQVIGGAIIVLGVWLTRRASIVPPAVRSRLSSAA
jgi:drug/metabolite transporter (DMT)-like permease